METKPKNRDWVKNAAIIVLAVLLVLTFFSNTIRNRNLPEVSTQNVTDGTINAKVRGTGTVTANGNHQVKAEQTREIRAVMVKSGQHVEAGDVLFVLGSGDSAELEAAQEQLRQLQLSYHRAALGGTSNNYEADQLRVDALKSEWDKAQAAMNAINPYSDSDRYQQLQKDLEKATAERDAAKEAYDKVFAEASTQLSDAESERLSAEQEVILKENDLAEGSEPLPLGPEVGKEELQDYLDDPEGTVKYLEDNLEPDTDRVDKWRELRDKTTAVTNAKAALNAVSSQELDAAQAKVDGIQREMAEFSNSPEYQAAVAAEREAHAAYLDAYYALEARKSADAKANAALGLEMTEISTQIEVQKKKIAELSGGEQNQIVAKVSGTVQSVSCTTGDTVPKDQVLCVIEVPDMGYTLSFSVTNQQASRLKIGDSATVSNYYWGSQIVATLQSIQIDPKNPQTNKLLTFEISGDVNAGSELTISVGQRSASYDTIVPKSAIKQDSNGDFVYIIESKSSPLGNRYIARRVSVEILAQDDNNAAVVGELSWGDFVITSSNAPLKNGDQVRLAD